MSSTWAFGKPRMNTFFKAGAHWPVLRTPKRYQGTRVLTTRRLGTPTWRKTLGGVSSQSARPSVDFSQPSIPSGARTLSAARRVTHINCHTVGRATKRPPAPSETPRASRCAKFAQTSSPVGQEPGANLSLNQPIRQPLPLPALFSQAFAAPAALLPSRVYARPAVGLSWKRIKIEKSLKVPAATGFNWGVTESNRRPAD
jgi:hypothetical protein